MNGRRTSRIAAILSLVAGAVLAAPADDAWVKRGTWQESLRLSREKLARLEAEATDVPNTPELGPWYRVGPFPADAKQGFDTPFPPLAGIDLKKPCGGKAWEKAKGYTDGKVNQLSAPGKSATFLYRSVTVPQPRELTAFFGSDDGLGVWLNGESLIANNANRGAGPNQDKAVLKLRKGRNDLLLMIYNNQGGHAFYFSVNEAAGNPRDIARQALTDKARATFATPGSAREIAWEERDGIWAEDWQPGDAAALANRYAAACAIPEFAAAAAAAAKTCTDEAGLQAVRESYYLSKRAEDVAALLARVAIVPLRRAVEDLSATFPNEYPGDRMRARLAQFEERFGSLATDAAVKDAAAVERLTALEADWQEFRREALLANPLLDFDSILYVKRRGKEGLTQNWQGNDRLHGQSFDNEIAQFSLRDPAAEDRLVYKPEKPIFVGDVDLHFSGNRVLFSTDGTVCEVGIDGTGFREVITEVDSYDPCYLPDGRILFISNNACHAVPCVSGNDYVGNIHIANGDGGGIRRLCFDQDNNWNPTVLPNGRVLYTRWEYTDSAHYFSRVLMHMNPDGTNQTEFYGSNSYWPNSMFYARPIPDSNSRFVAIVSGHHGPARMGELVLFDAGKGRHEAGGALQKIPGYGKPVEPVIVDNLVGSVWPKFLHPFPLGENYFLVSCRPDAKSSWGIYLVDTFDNMLPLRSLPGTHCLEPVPVKPTRTPPVIADRVRLDDPEATIYLADVYSGQGLRDVPRGTVKSLRVYQYEYAYRNTGGHYVVGYEGPWDVRRLLGTVPVFDDGSAVFKIPANTPISVQPLDEEGQAMALMRSWMVGMPGEVVSCVGCHEQQNSAPFTRMTLASRSKPLPIKPWRGPTRGFSFRREVQPVLDKFCVGCHDGTKEGRPSFADDGEEMSFPTAQSAYSKPYIALHPYVRRNGPEGDYHTLTPLEFHANTSELVQLLRKGHHGVELDREGWDRLITWIDLNVPYHGTWKEATRGKVTDELVTTRYENRKKYSDVEEDIEEIINPYTPGSVAFVKPDRPRAEKSEPPAVEGWPFAPERAAALQGEAPTLTLDLGGGVSMDFVRIPAGTFLMGDDGGDADERPAAAMRVAEPFWMGVHEVTNAQYAAFDPAHDSGVYDMRYKDQVNRGYYVNQPDKPVIRVSWQRASDFCAWLTETAGRPAELPTEAQWEWACRAGSASPLSFGGADADFAPFANLSDVTTKQLAVSGVDPKPIRNPHPLAAFHPAVLEVNDGVLHLAPPKTYAANAWGLYDMHGNVAEWTRSRYAAYPYRDGDGRNDTDDTMAERVVRGGAWNDRPHRARSSFRLAYPGWQQVFNVGFRVVLPARASDAAGQARVR